MEGAAVILTIDKPPGWTPLEAMEALRAGTPALAGEKMVYAGRLDPMAEGLLLVLTGEDRYALDAHLRYDKDYTATILFGIRSDTFDALGRLAPGGPPELAACIAAVSGLVGDHVLPLPIWSAYRVGGRPLHAWAREGQAVALPHRTMSVTAVDGVSATPVRAAALLEEVHERIGRVRGVFRQEEARADWARLSAANPPLLALNVRLSVTSGTYVRSLVHSVGESLGCGALLLSLRRTRIGAYHSAVVVKSGQATTYTATERAIR